MTTHAVRRRLSLLAATSFLLALAALPRTATAQPHQHEGPAADALSTSERLETVHAFEGARPGNPTVTPGGRVIVTMSSLSSPEVNVNEVLPDGELRPFPNEVWATRPGPDGRGIWATIGIGAARDGTVWILDMGNLAEGHLPKLVGWNTDAERLKRVITFPRASLRPSSFCQDLAVDLRRGKIYVADMTLDEKTGRSDYPAFLVVDLETGRVRRVLEGHATLMPTGEPITIDGQKVGHRAEDGRRVAHQYGLNPIAIDPQGEWVYYGAMSGRAVYRLPAAALADASLSEEELAGQIEVYASKPHSDGIAVDAGGNVYVTDVENFAVGVTSAENGYRTLTQDRELLSWPDGLSISEEGWLYVTANQLHNLPGLNYGEDASDPPYYLHRLSLPGASGMASEETVSQEAGR